MSKVIAYTTHRKPFRVLVPGSGRVLEFGEKPEEYDLSSEELDAVRARKKQGAPLEIVPLSKRAAEQLEELAAQAAAAEARTRELEATFGARIAELEAELDDVHEKAHGERQALGRDLAEAQERIRAHEQLEQDLRAELSAAQRRVAELEDGARELERARKELDEARTKISRFEAQKKR